jgi:haloalkane dehalogenase
VMHGWGSIIGFNYAMQHESNCKGLVFYEAYLRSLNEEDLSLPYQEQITNMLHEIANFDLVMNSTFFVDKVLPQGMMRPLTDEEMSHYREPFLQQGAGKPLKQYLEEIPRLHAQGQVAKVNVVFSARIYYNYGHSNLGPRQFTAS